MLLLLLLLGCWAAAAAAADAPAGVAVNRRLLEQTTPHAIGRGGQHHVSDLANGPVLCEWCQMLLLTF